MTNAEVIDVVLLSLRVAALAILVALPLSIIVARYLSKGGASRVVVSTLVHLPLVLPPVATGYVLLLAFGPKGWVGQYLENLGLGVGFSWVGAALAAGIMAFPLLVRPIRLAFENVDPRLEEAASTLGAGRRRVFLTITLPLAWPGVVAGSVLGFAKALGEFGATITFVSNIPGETQTISLAIYSLLQSPEGDRSALHLIGISVLISFVAVLLSEVLTARFGRRQSSNE